MEKSLSNNSMNRKQQSTIVQTECKICGAPAKYSFFGVVSCNTCKMFFKRNGERGKETLKCLYDGHCEININNRHICSYCRLIKCLNSGMQVELIRSSYPKRNKTNRKKILITSTQQTASPIQSKFNEPQQFPTLNLLQSDQSTLTIDQWNLLSNLSHCYDDHSGLSIGKRFMLARNVLPLKLRWKKGSVVELIEMSLNTCQSLYTKNQDFLSLSARDRSILLHNTFKHTGSLSSNFIIYKIHIMDCPTYLNVVEMVTHSNVIPVAKRIASRLNFDMIIMKLFLVILTFSTTRYTVYSNIPAVNLSNIKEILRIQDTYIELTWQYLLYKYDFERAVKCLSDFIRCFFAIDEAVVTMRDVQWLTDTISSMVSQIEQSLTLN
ncbi:unnamed protein product [Rotaria sordida]|uniref:Nuclear receptor domain-containing protein n=1 Tax=Rotaria sordida TaxID=392033 RepID=A0A819I8U0_9BILA|nr:unnamed protein product [Rotaria sordida]CAF3910723.1 unnamed protein product [Rotaria sordida]CAF4172262.1 unnamed protein product [Rotaria sordida]